MHQNLTNWTTLVLAKPQDQRGVNIFCYKLDREAYLATIS